MDTVQWPDTPASFQPRFLAATHTLYKVAISTLRAVSSAQLPVRGNAKRSPSHRAGGPSSVSTVGGAGASVAATSAMLTSSDASTADRSAPPRTQPFMGADTMAAIEELAPRLSGLNLIRYFPQPPPPQPPQPPQQPPRHSAALVDVCSAHEDTGLLTFAAAGEVPGLVMFDQHLKRWIPLEELARPGWDMLVFMGKKLPMFASQPTAVKASPHAVLVRPGKARVSTVFLLDIAK